MNDRPGDAEYLTALAPPNNSLLPTGIPAGIGELVHGKSSGGTSDISDFRLANYFQCVLSGQRFEKETHDKARLAAIELERQLADAKAVIDLANVALGNAGEHEASLLDENKQLQAALDREREARLRAEKERTEIEEALVSMEANANDLFEKLDRAEAGAALVIVAATPIVDEMYKVLDQTGGRDGDETDRVYPWYEIEPLANAIRNKEQPGARLAAVLEDEMKKPCEITYVDGGDCLSNKQGEAGRHVCTRCRLVDAMELGK